MASTSDGFQGIKNLKRIDIVNSLAVLDIKPNNEEFKTKYVEYLCEKCFVEESELPGSVYYDIYQIKNWYSVAKSDIPRMYKKHTKFFDTEIKIKRVPDVPPPKVKIVFL